VVTPLRPLHSAGRERRTRSELVRRGSIEAVVTLPPGVRSNTSIPLTLWVLRAPDSVDAPERVLLVDGNALAAPAAPRRTPLTDKLTEAIINTVTSWRNQGEITDPQTPQRYPFGSCWPPTGQRRDHH
jgi:type I restriction-modification system DNA methylase subunit